MLNKIVKKVCVVQFLLSHRSFRSQNNSPTEVPINLDSLVYFFLSIQRERERERERETYSRYEFSLGVIWGIHVES